MTTKLPPQDLESEMSVIASVLLQPDVLDEIGDLRSEHFYNTRNQEIWSVILGLRLKGKQIDSVIVASELERIQKLEEVGGVEYLVQCMNTVAHSGHAKTYAAQVLSRWRSRLARYGCSELIEYVEAGATDDEIAAKAEKTLTAISERLSVATDVAIRDVLVDAWDAIQSRIKDGVASGVQTGFTDLDNLLVCLQPGELVILAARPAMGKTAFAGCVMLNLARSGVGVLFVSCEMSKLEIGERLICVDSGVSGTKLKNGDIVDEWEIDALLKSAGRISELPLRIDDQPNQKLRQIAATARRSKRKHNIGLVIIDYLQLIEPNDSKEIREQEVASITKGLKGLAKELELPIIVLAQLNRGVESREDKKPRLSDLRESGSIEQDADKVLFLHRPEAYDPDQRKGECDVVVAKNRCGKIGQVTLAWLADSTAFKDLARETTFEQATKAFSPPDWAA